MIHALKQDGMNSVDIVIKRKKGHRTSEETKRKLSIRAKEYLKDKTKHPMFGKPRSEKTKMKISMAHQGKILSEEHKKKISQSMKGKNRGNKNPMFGRFKEKNSFWHGGKSFEPYTPDFNKRLKKAIKERDHYCCQMCNIGIDDLHLLKRNLCIHHIDYNKNNSFLQNCICLCNRCHATTNINRNNWKTFFQSLLKERYGYEYTEDQKIILDFTGEKI